MPSHRKPRLEGQARRTVRSAMERLGADLRRSRLARRWSQRELAERVGRSQSTISDIELGRGGSLSVDTWQRLALVLDRDLRITLGRDAREEPEDAGHLGVQELVLRGAPGAGYDGRFELTADASRSSDVGLIAAAARRLVLVECINTVGDLGAAARSSDRKRRAAQDLAIARGGDAPWTVHTCWVINDVRRNRELVARYPAIFAARFPGSSSAWVKALTRDDPPPAEPGLVWADVRGGRLLAHRARPPAPAPAVRVDQAGRA